MYFLRTGHFNRYLSEPGWYTISLMCLFPIVQNGLQITKIMSCGQIIAHISWSVCHIPGIVWNVLHIWILTLTTHLWNAYCWASGKQSASAGGVRDTGLTPGDQVWPRGSIRSPGGGHGNPFQYSCLENPMDRGARQAAVHWSQRVGHDWSELTLDMPIIKMRKLKFRLHNLLEVT